MRIITTISIIFLAGSQAFTQVDLSTNPLGIIFKYMHLYTDVPVSQSISVEGGLGYSFDRFEVLETEYKSSGIVIRALGKYYFSPKNGHDRFNIGPYARFASAKIKYSGENVNNSRLGIGLYGGYKWVTKGNIIFELGIGMGRAFINKYTSDLSSFNANDWPAGNFDVTGKMAVGYRF